MGTIKLDKRRSWILDTELDRDGEMWVCDEEDSEPAFYLDTAKMLTLRDIFDSITSKCLCNYDVAKRICDEYDTYTLAKIDPKCPFHGEQET